MFGVIRIGGQKWPGSTAGQTFVDKGHFIEKTFVESPNEYGRKDTKLIGQVHSKIDGPHDGHGVAEAKQFGE